MKTTFTKLHLIENNGYWTIPRSGIMESGFWYFSLEKAKTFIGCTLLLQRSQTGPAYQGGEILDVAVQKGGTHAGRIVFTVKLANAYIGTPSPGHFARWWTVS
jgi:hypothetical protein